MTEKELGWLAGFLEGEGSVGLRRCRKKPGYAIYLRPRIEACQVQLEPLLKVQALVGGWVGRKSGKRRGKQSMINIWILQGESAALVMRFLYPEMSMKRQTQFARVLHAWDTRAINRNRSNPRVNAQIRSLVFA